MICDNCAWKDGCLTRKAPGQHRIKCDEYYPDLSQAKARQPAKIRTPEDRREEMETRAE